MDGGLARWTAEGRPIDRGPLNIHQVLNHVRRLSQNGFGKNVRFVESYDPSLPDVFGDRDQLIQVFLNLVKNACEVPGEGEREIELSTAFKHGLRLTVPGQQARVNLPLVVSVRDNGRGVSDEIRSHLFDAFVTNKPTGTGLGLALVAKIINDITEQRRTREELRTLQAEMVHLSRWNMMGMMAASLAHELNQPLPAMINYVRAARRMLADLPGLEKAREFLDRAADETKLAGGIIRSLRDFIEKRETSRRPDDINAALEEGLALSLSVNNADKARICRVLNPDLPLVMMDRVQIQQVLLNLVRNAFEAMQDSRAGLVCIESDLGEPGFVLVCVSDTGPGLSPEIARQLFQPFQTTKQDGMGVGLSICQMIVEAHGGRIWAEPNQPQGVVFRFQLPVAPVP